MNLIVNGVMEKINRLIVQRATCMTENQFAAEIKEWKASLRRGTQIKGSDYYEGRHEILNRQRLAIGRDGYLVPVKNLPNNKLIDNQYAKAVDQKVNYFVGKPFTVSCEDQSYSDLLAGYFNRGFFRQLKYLAEDALNNGLAWLYPYYGDDGQLAFKRFSGYEVLPFWADDDHTRLDCAARLYMQEVWNGYAKETVEKVELFRKDGIHRYIFQNDMLLPDTEAGEYETYFTGPGPDGPDTGYNWERIPLIPFKYNKQEIPLIQRVKSLQDAINTLLSDFTNNMQEDARNTILILRNYDGEDLGKFRENLSAYGAVKVRDDGGVETLTVEVNSDNYKAILDLLKKALIENAKSYDAKDDRLSGNPNQMNIQSMYADIDLDANGMETEFQAAFEDLLWFINKDLVNRGKGDFEDIPVTIVFNRDMLINETESITNCRNSVGLLSNRTIVEQHPWVTDAQTELDRLAEEKAAQAQDGYTPTTFNA